MTRYIVQHKDRYGVEPICRVLQFAPSTYCEAKSRPPSARALREQELRPEIERVHRQSFASAAFGRRAWLEQGWRFLQLSGALARSWWQRRPPYRQQPFAIGLPAIEVGTSEVIAVQFALELGAESRAIASLLPDSRQARSN
jgi:hypothetical protein